MSKILIIDDDPAIRGQYRSVLESEIEAAEVMEAASWQEGINWLMFVPEVDLVLLDIRMPDVDGSVVYDIIRLYNPRIRVLVSSVYPTDEQKQLILRADGYFDKSTGTERLLEWVRCLLGSSGKSAPSGERRLS